MLGKLYHYYCKLEELIVGLGFGIIVVLTFMNAVLRTFGNPIVYADDFCKLLFSWAAFLGADVALRYSRLVGMDILVKKFSPKTQKSLQILSYVFIIIIMYILIGGGITIIQTNGLRSFNTLSVFGINYAMVNLSLPVCGVMMIFTSLVKIGKILQHFSDDDYNVRKDNPDQVGEENTPGDDENSFADEDTQEVQA